MNRSESMLRRAVPPAWVAKPWQIGFFDLVSKLLNENTAAPDPHKLVSNPNNYLRFTVNSDTASPLGEVDRVMFNYDPQTKKSVVNVQTNFLGLLGQGSPLPSLSERLAEDWLADYHHRLLCLCYEVWARFKFSLENNQCAKSLYRRRIFALLGDAPEVLHGNEVNMPGVVTDYLGAMVAGAGTVALLEQVTSALYPDYKVFVQQNVPRRMPVPARQRCFLGKQNSLLGKNTVLGCKLTECMSVFYLVFVGVKFTQLGDFVPGAQKLETLKCVLRLLLQQDRPFGLHLKLVGSEPPGLGFSSLGCSAWTYHRAGEYWLELSPEKIPAPG